MDPGGGDLPDWTPVLVTRSPINTAWRRLVTGPLHAAHVPQDEPPAATSPRGAGSSRPPGARQKLYVALRRGATLNAAAAQAGVDLVYAEIMCDEMKRQGLLDRAESLCASGLGACGGGTSDEVKIHCAGCPIVPLKVS